MDDTTIRVGFQYISGGDEAVGALGVSGYALGDGQAQSQAVVDYLNANGGVAGRSIELLQYPFAAGQPIDPQMQAACEHWTTDNHVLVATVSTSTVNDVMYDCLASRDVALVQDIVPGDAEQFGRYPAHLYSPSDAVKDRLVAEEIEALVTSGFLTPDKTIGINRFDLPADDRVMAAVVEPLFQQHGLEIAAEFAMQATTDGYAQVPGAVLAFRAANVDTVYDLTTPLLFMIQADSQGYQPDYSVNSYYSPGGLLEGTVPRGQLEGAQGIGWIPPSDVNANQNPGPVTPNETLCTQLMEDAGQDMSSSTTRATAMWICGHLLSIAAMLDAAPELTPAGMAAGMAQAGGFPAPTTWQTRWLPDQRDGLASYRHTVFDSDCGCFAYSSDQVAIR